MPGPTPSGDECTIDRLAERAGMTVRNVRAHLSRGLLPAGEMRGRTAWYGPEHLARLELIAGLQRRGFSLAAIGVLIHQTPSGSAEEALRLYRGMLAPWEPEEPVEIDEDAWPGWVGGDVPARVLDVFGATGVVERPAEGRLRILNPALARAGAHAVALGLSPESVAEVGVELRERTREIADVFVGLFREQLWQAHVAAGMPRDGVADLRTTVEALQPVATRSLLAAFRQTMQEAMDDAVREVSADLEAEAPAGQDRQPGQDRRPAQRARQYPVA